MRLNEKEILKKALQQSYDYIRRYETVDIYVDMKR